MATHFPIVFEQEESGAFSAYVAGLPVYAQGRTQAQAASAIVRTLRAYLEAHPQEPPRAEVQVAKVSAPTNRFARPTASLATAAALVGRRRSVRFAIGGLVSERQNLEMQGRTPANQRTESIEGQASCHGALTRFFTIDMFPAPASLVRAKRNMDVKALLKIGVVAGVLMNALDIIVQGTLMAGLYTAPVFRNPEEEIVYLVLTDFVAAFVFAWIYLKLGSATGPGVAGGATFGFYAGMLYSFPMFYAMHLLFNGYTSGLAWLNTAYQVIVYVIVGATAGALNKARPAASR